MKNVFKKFLLNRRAITPVLSNLLLTVIAVAAMSLATTATYVITNNLRQTMGERVIIEDVWFHDETVSVYLRNIGKVSVTISAVYINHTRQYLPTKFHLELGEHGWLNITYSWLPNRVYYLDIITSRGNHVEGYYKAS
ncbi:hypothetical protein CW708_00190 [Candidatus Bathyarchaeota archaeon]|nr:MAG: hypothetical protein CW708_00190 [Candidatus Bathyarchaeota archaeon]